MPTAAPAAPSRATNSGRYRVQMAAFRSQAEVEKSWNRLKGSNNDLLGGYTLMMERADLGAQGIYYRLQIGPLATKDDASRLCGRLKQRSLNCFVVRK